MKAAPRRHKQWVWMDGPEQEPYPLGVQVTLRPARDRAHPLIGVVVQANKPSPPFSQERVFYLRTPSGRNIVIGVDDIVEYEGELYRRRYEVSSGQLDADARDIQ